MFFLDTGSKTLQVVLAAAKTISDLTFVVGWADYTTSTFFPAANEGVTNGTTPVTVAAAPPASTARQIKYLSVYNADTTNTQVFVQINDGVARIMVSPTLAPGESLVYDEHNGWQTLTITGAIKTTSGSTPVVVAVFVFNETPSGTVDGTNATFTLMNAPVAGTVRVYVDGVRMAPTGDYNISGSAITFVSGAIPQTGDIILVDYIVVAPGTPMSVFNETPSGTVNGTNPTFTLANTPTSGTVTLYVDGLRMDPGADYTISSATITFLTGAIPQTGDTLLADYQM